MPPKAESGGLTLGVGKGRGVGLLFVVSGAALGVLCLCMRLYRPMRRLDSLVRDEAEAPVPLMSPIGTPQVDAV
ncbi:MAG TPA: hypothetical protein VJA19_01320 [Pseudomonas sp.]|nr:hypothetical protein [Pseudomonas sp.]